MSVDGSSVSIDRETHQVLVSIDGPVSIVAALPPYLEREEIVGAIDELAKELDHALALGPELAAAVDLTGDGGDDSEKEEEWNPEPAKLREGETPDVSGHARRNAEQLRIAERALQEENDDDEEEGSS